MNTICKLILLPHAGSSVINYKKFQPFFNNSGIELVFVEYAGRGKRFLESQYHTMSELIGDIFIKMRNVFEFEKYAFFGHSMGADIACYLTDDIINKKMPEPMHMFLSSRTPPNADKKIKYHVLNDDDLIVELLNLSKSNRDFLENDELSQIFLPILRNDFRLIETVDDHGSFKFNCDLSILYGDEEDLCLDSLLKWKEYTNGKCDVEKFEGDHFYLFNNCKKISNIIKSKLIEGVSDEIL